MASPFDMSGDIETCRLVRADLIELFKLVQEGFPQPDRTVTKIALHLSRTNIEENDISSFLSNSNLPREIDDQLLITVYENTGESVTDTRWVLIQLYHNLKLQFFNVKGEERNWVIGTHKVLNDFFARKTMRFAFLRKKLFGKIDLFYVLTDINILGTSIGLIFFLIARNFLVSIALCALLAFWSYISWLYTQRILLKPIIILPTKGKRRITRDDIAFVFGILGTFATIISIIPIIQSWFQ